LKISLAIEQNVISMSIAIATTILHPPVFLRQWLDYHLRRVQHILFYLDDPSERPILEAACADRPVSILDGEQNHPEMSPESRTILRQGTNIQHAVAFLADRNYTWLLHIDVDELLYEPVPEARSWNLRPEIGCVNFINHEAVPLDRPTRNPFVDCLYFRLSRRAPFMAYGNGKSAVRIGPDVLPFGPHKFRGFEGELLAPSGDGAMILHYPTPCFDDWVAKFTHYGRFSDNWYDDPATPNHVTFMLRSRDVVQAAVESGDWSGARAFFDEQTLDDASIESAIAAGTIRRYTPVAES